MRYVAPYGITDPNASYVNGDPSIGRQGSIPPAAAFENPMREIVNVISKSVITPDDTDLVQMAKAVRSQRMNFASDVGAVNAMVVAYDPPLSAYTQGLPLRVLVAYTNTASAVTLNAGAGAQPVKKMDGTNVAIGDIVAGAVIQVTWTGTVWQLTNWFGQSAGPPVITNIGIPYCVDSSPTANTIVANFSPALTAATVVAGTPILVKIANTNTGPTAINVNALPGRIVYPRGDSTAAGDPVPCVHSDMVKGDVVLLVYDGTAWWIEPNVIIVSDALINVPSQYPTPAAALLALKRKLIAPTASVTIKLAAGTYTGFSINHPNAERISVIGTMLAAAPTRSNFTVTGNSAAARSSDAASNLAMLKTRYGTWVTFDVNTTGIWSMSSLPPSIGDMLIIGNYNQQTGGGAFDPAAGGAGCGVFCGTALGVGQRMMCVNIAVWGAPGVGFMNGGDMRLINCWSTGSRGIGIQTTANGKLYAQGGGSLGSDMHGICAFASTGMLVFTGNYEQNGGGGAVASDGSYILVSQCTVLGNVNPDIYSLIQSCIKTFQSSFATISPNASVGSSTVGNYNSINLVS